MKWRIIPNEVERRKFEEDNAKAVEMSMILELEKTKIKEENQRLVKEAKK